MNTVPPVNPRLPDNELLNASEPQSASPTPARSAAPRVEYKTLVQAIYPAEAAAAADAELNDWLNRDDAAEPWEVFQIGDGRVIERLGTAQMRLEVWRTVVLFRVPAEDKPARSFTEVIAEMKDMPGVAGVVIEPVPMPDDTQEITPVVTPVVTPTVPQPALAQDTRPTLRDRDFAFLTAPAPGELKH